MYLITHLTGSMHLIKTWLVGPTNVPRQFQRCNVQNESEQRACQSLSTLATTSLQSLIMIDHQLFRQLVGPYVLNRVVEPARNCV